MTVSNKQIAVISNNLAVSGVLESTLKSHYDVFIFPTIHSALDFIYNSMPDLVIVEILSAGDTAVKIINDLKSDPLFGQVNILALLPDVFPFASWSDFLVEDYIKASAIQTEIFTRVSLCLARSERVVEVNPLTRLPGNIAITKQIQARLDSGDIFALAYADIDHFKPFNDKYGFSRGDEVIKMVGRLILNTVRNVQPTNSFVGHIGGDDFTFITTCENIDAVAKSVRDNFSIIIQTFYDDEDRNKGCIQSVDREGNKKTFPIMGISIGIAQNMQRKFTHYGEMSEVASEMKKYAKLSQYGICKDKRRG